MIIASKSRIIYGNRRPITGIKEHRSIIVRDRVGIKSIMLNIVRVPRVGIIPLFIADRIMNRGAERSVGKIVRIWRS